MSDALKVVLVLCIIVAIVVVVNLISHDETASAFKQTDYHQKLHSLQAEHGLCMSGEYGEDQERCKQFVDQYRFLLSQENTLKAKFEECFKGTSNKDSCYRNLSDTIVQEKKS